MGCCLTSPGIPPTQFYAPPPLAARLVDKQVPPNVAVLTDTMQEVSLKSPGVLADYQDNTQDLAPLRADHKYVATAIICRQAHSVVYRAVVGGNVYALKRLTVDGKFNCIESAENEIAMLRRCAGHPAVLRLHDAWREDAGEAVDYHDNSRRGPGPAPNGSARRYEYSLLTALADRSLADAIAKGALPAAQLVPLMRDLLQGVAHCHALGVVHGDLKPENLLLTDHLTGTRSCTLAICDFGLAIAYPRRLWALLSAPSFRAPEVNTDAGYAVTPALDMWSIGCIVAEAATGGSLFPGPLNAAPANVKELRAIAVAARVAPAIAAVITALVRVRPGDRLSAAAALALPLFAGDKKSP